MPKIAALERLTETTSWSGNGDNWHMTWASNDKIYTALDDGYGWPGMPQLPDQYYNTRVYVVNGQPPNHEFEFLPSFPTINAMGLHYGFAILAINDTYIYHYMSQRARPSDGEFIGIKLIYSDDNGQTWYNQDGTSPVRWEPAEQRDRSTMLFWHEPDETLALLSFLQMGRNYELNKDGYAYVYGPNGYVDGKANQMVMFRIPIDRYDAEITRRNILNRGCYEYFVSREADGSARWSRNIEDRGVVHTFPTGWLNTGDPYAWHPCVVYYPPTDEYLMANWGNGNIGGERFAKPSYLGFWTAPKPWGPWKQVHEETMWLAGDPNDLGARGYQPQICPKWISDDGREFDLVWTEYRFCDNKPESQSDGKLDDRYAFNTQKVRVTLSADPA